jgi:broad specificity phosphatase PhoE
MTRLFILRHGQASFFEADYDQLSSAGETQSQCCGHYFASQGTQIHQVFVGPRKRHLGTWKQLSETAAKSQFQLPSMKVRENLDELPAFELLQNGLPALLEQRPELREGFNENGTPRDPALHAQAFRAILGQWTKGESSTTGIETFEAFKGRITQEFLRAAALCNPGENALIVTSGGPVSIAMQHAVGFANDKVIDTAFSVANASISSFEVHENQFSLLDFNQTAHLKDQDLVTFV